MIYLLIFIAAIIFLAYINKHTQPVKEDEVVNEFLIGRAEHLGRKHQTDLRVYNNLNTRVQSASKLFPEMFSVILMQTILRDYEKEVDDIHKNYGDGKDDATYRKEMGGLLDRADTPKIRQLKKVKFGYESLVNKYDEIIDLFFNYTGKYVKNNDEWSIVKGLNDLQGMCFDFLDFLRELRDNLPKSVNNTTEEWGEKNYKNCSEAITKEDSKLDGIRVSIDDMYYKE